MAALEASVAQARGRRHALAAEREALARPFVHGLPPEGPHAHLRHWALPNVYPSRGRPRVLRAWSAVSVSFLLAALALIVLGQTGELLPALGSLSLVMLCAEAFARSQLLRFLAGLLAVGAIVALALVVVLAALSNWRWPAHPGRAHPAAREHPGLHPQVLNHVLRRWHCGITLSGGSAATGRLPAWSGRRIRERVMRTILNVIWLLLAGLWMAFFYVLAGFIAFVLIITIPFGIAAFRIAAYVLWPFGRTIERRRRAGAGALIGNIIWIVVFGWELAVGHLVTGVLLCLTVIGIPLGIANFKLIPVSLVPLGTRIVRAA